jgi:hypothetical protein
MGKSMKRQATTEITRSPTSKPSGDGRSWRNSLNSRTGSRRSNSRHACYALYSSRSARAQAVGRVARERIQADDDVDNPLDLKRAS